MLVDPINENLTAGSPLAGFYTDLHAHPEHGFHEHRTAGIVATAARTWMPPG